VVTVLVKVLSGKRIRLPHKFCEKYNIMEGDYLKAEIKNGLIIIAVEIRPKGGVKND